MNFAEVSWLWSLLLLLPVIGLLIWSWRKRQKLLTQFVSPRLLESLMEGVSKQRQKFRLVLLVLAIGLALVSLARPRFGYSLEELRQSGLDIVVAIDTSKSMLANDVQPNRLERAKLAAIDLMRLARNDRLGLVAFAGSAFLQCPLSLDEGAFQQSVDFLDVSVIPQGGTALTEAILTARSAFKDEAENHKILVLFTDGEDNEDAKGAVEAAKEARKAGLRIFTVGVGTPNGEILSTSDPYGNRVFIKDAQGNVVKSRLDESLLQQLAKETDGFYLPLTGARTMDVLYERGLAPLPKSDFSATTRRQFHERFQWFIGAAILLLLAEMLFPERKRKQAQAMKGQGQAARPVAVSVAVALLLCASHAFASVNDALKDYQRGKFSKARSEFERLAKKSPDDARLRYNAGTAAFGDEDYETALKHFNASLSSPDLKLQGQSYYNLGNSHFRLGEKSEDPKSKQEQWEQAVRQFETALKLDANDADAKFNLDVVKKKLEELKQQQQQQQQQNQDKDKQDKQDEQKKDDQQQQQQDQQKKDEQQKQDKSEQEKKDQQQKQDQQQQQDQQKKDEQSQQQQQQQQQQQNQQDQSEQQKQQAQDQRGQEPGKEGQQQNYARVMQMTPQQAQQLLDAQKNEERAMIFQPQNTRTNRPRDRVFKDW